MMEPNNERSHQLLETPSCEASMAVEYIDTMCLENGVNPVGSTAATLTTQDGTTLPVTLIVSEPSIANGGNNSPVKNKSDVPVLTTPTSDGETATQFVIEHIAAGMEIPQTLYTIQFSEGQSQECVDSGEDKNSDEAIQEIEGTSVAVANVDADSLQHQSDLHIMETTTRLEDFMDVVTTYKCKFCRFSCAWKSGLMSHIRNCHLDASNQASSAESQAQNYTLSAQKDETAIVEINREETEKIKADECLQQESAVTSPKNSKHNSTQMNSLISIDGDLGTGMVPPQERHIFLCGQCSKGFSSLEGCKQHMIKDHNLKLEPSISREKTTGPPKKRGRPRTRPYPNLTSDCSASKEESRADYSLDETDDNIQYQDEKELTAKRKVRPPKGLEEDYYLGAKKKRVRRESLSDRMYRCNERGCGYRFSTEANLHYHARCHTTDEKPFSCPECSDKSDHWRGLAVHLWKEHTIDMDLHTCSVCGYKTYSHFKLDNHKRIHSDEREFVCSTCGKGFKQLSQLRNHYVIHMDRKNMPEKRWYSEQKCDICHRTFSDSKCLRKHQQAVHNKLKPYVCTYCGHMSARKAMLQLHMRQHTGEKPFLCEHCEYRTGDHNSLRRHRMRHTGTKPYKCPHCPYACIQAISYKTHLKNKHPGMEGLFACTLCAFRSVSKENYINHMSDHRRGAIPSTSEANGGNSLNQSITSEHVAAQGSAQLHLPENTLQQLEGMLPGNITAAQLIYSCLNALSQEGGSVNLPPGVTTSSTGDGTQTITIQLPTAQELEHEQYYFTIQQQDGSTAAAALVLPSSLEDNSVTDSNTQMEILHPITIMHEDVSDSHSLDSSVFIGADNDQMNSVDSNSLVIAHGENQDTSADSNNTQTVLEEASSKCCL